MDTKVGPLKLEFGNDDSVDNNLCKSCKTKQAVLAPPKRPLSPYIFFSQEVRFQLN